MKTILMTFILLSVAGGTTLKAQAGGNLSDHASPNSKARKSNTSQTQPPNKSVDKSDKANRRMGMTPANSITANQGKANRSNQSGTTKSSSTTSNPPKRK